MIKTDYLFTDKERLYFERLQQAFNQGVGAGIQMIVTQQDLAGQWRMKPDGSGIERADLPPNAQFVTGLSVAEDEAAKPNGLA